MDSDHYSYEYKEDVKGIIHDWIEQSNKDRCDYVHLMVIYLTLTLVKPLLEDPRFQIRVILSYQKKKLVGEKLALTVLPYFRSSDSDGRYHTSKQANTPTYYVPTINRK